MVVHSHGIGPVWNHYTCFWGPKYKTDSGFSWATSINNSDNFEGVDQLKVEDQQMVHQQMKGVPMKDDEVAEAEELQEIVQENARIEESQKLKEVAEANAFFTDNDPQTVIYTMVNKQLDGMKMPDIKEVIKTNAIDCKKKRKKADLIQVILDQGVNKISSLAFSSLNKHVTVNSLKDMLKAKGESVAGTKKDLILRVLRCSGGGAGAGSSQNLNIPSNPAPALSAKEMGPDEDLVHEEWPHLQPYATIGSKEDIRRLLDDKSVPRHLKIAAKLSIQHDDFKELLAAVGLELIVLEAGDSETGCRLDTWGAAVIADHCPRLQKLHLESCTFSDQDLIKIGYCCPRIRYLSINGNNKSSGNIKDKFLKNFKEDRSFLKKLKILSLYDQSNDFTQLEKMSKARRSVMVKTGESGHDYWGGGSSMAMKGGKFHF